MLRMSQRRSSAFGLALRAVTPLKGKGALLRPSSAYSELQLSGMVHHLFHSCHHRRGQSEDIINISSTVTDHEPRLRQVLKPSRHYDRRSLGPLADPPGRKATSLGICDIQFE